jgi:hypothetical protein
MMQDSYIDTVRLLLAIAPYVFDTRVLAMKGGTALNLFHQDMPRLSVDIDVAFVDHVPQRDAALQQINHELHRARSAIEDLGYRVDMRNLTPSARNKGEDIKLVVISENASVKVEVNYVFRGTLLPVQDAVLAEAAQDMFELGVTLPVLDVAELYGSKLVAAMDRQHPRDIFDVLLMYETHGLRPECVDCFVGYLAGHNRPPHEVIFPVIKSLAGAYEADFVGMTSAPISLAELETARRRLMMELPRALSDDHKAFLLSLVKTEPDWSLMRFSHLPDLPAIRWKLQNLQKLRDTSAAGFQTQVLLLQQCLDRVG